MALKKDKESEYSYKGSEYSYKGNEVKDCYFMTRLKIYLT